MNSKKKTTSKRSAQNPLSAETKTVKLKRAAPGAATEMVVQPASSADKTAPKKVAKVAGRSVPKPPPAKTPAAAEVKPKPKPTTRPVAKSAPKSSSRPSVASPPSTPHKTSHPPRPLPAHLKVPEILLEDDTLPPQLAARFTPPPPEPEQEAEPVAVAVAVVVPRPAPTLPPHYGTRELSLIARDPFTLFAGWDFSEEEILEAQRASANGSVVLRIFRGEMVGPMVLELPVEPDRRHEFIPAPVSGTAYRAVLGMVTREQQWHELASSGVAFVPPEEAPVVAEPVLGAEPVTAWIAVDALSVSTAEAMAPAWIRMEPPVEPVIRSIAPTIRSVWHAPTILATWSPAMVGASEQLVGPGVPGPGAGGGAGVGPTVDQGPSSLEVGLSSEAAVPVAPEAGRDFWFKVNAEVVLYGSTERNAKVTIDGRPVRLRADGSFSFRFSLPDGEFTLPVTACAADGYSPREAVFRLAKSTERKGQIGDHSQDASLRPPLAGNAVSE